MDKDFGPDNSFQHHKMLFSFCSKHQIDDTMIK